jgi:hypothetical protein
MYYICKFSDSWSIYDVTRNNSRQLENKEIECLKALFPSLLQDTNKILMAIQVSSISPTKLLQLPNPDHQGSVKKKES